MKQDEPCILHICITSQGFFCFCFSPGTGTSHLETLRLASLCGEIHLFVAGTVDTTWKWSTDQPLTRQFLQKKHTHGGAWGGTLVICGQFIRILQGDSKSHHGLKVAAVHSLELWLPLATSMRNSDVLKPNHVWTIRFKHAIWAISIHIYGFVTGQHSKNTWKQRNHWNCHWLILHYLDSLLSPCQVLRSSDEKSCRERYRFWMPRGTTCIPPSVHYSVHHSTAKRKRHLNGLML